MAETTAAPSAVAPPSSPFFPHRCCMLPPPPARPRPPTCSGFRERLLADPGFMVKVGIEVGIGVCTKTTAEYTKRGDDFKSELDFVFANLVMAVIADFMLVWLPAPTFATK